jgi:hypothetical protein
MSKVVKFMAANLLAFASFLFPSVAYADCVQPHQAVTPTTEVEVQTVVTCGGDDVGYQIPLTVGVTFDGQSYDKVYATTNSVITFGRPDGTYWDYPQTPSISLYSMDWLIIPSRNADEHLIIQSSQGGFLVDISARPYGNYGVPVATNIVITAAINSDGSVAISYMVNGPTYEGQTRTGVRLLNGDIVNLETYGIVQVVEPVILPVIPVEPTPSPSPEPVPEFVPTPEPAPQPAPPIEEPPVPTPEPEPTPPAPAPEPPEEPEPAPEPPPVPTPAPEPPAPALEPNEPPPPILDPELLDPETMTNEEVAELTLVAEATLQTTEPGSEQYQEALAQLMVVAQADDPQVSEALAAIPLLGNAAVAVLDAFNAVGNIGADIAPDVREEAQKVVVSSVIVGQIAATASLAAVGTSYRRIK